MPNKPRNAYYCNESFEQDGITGREFVLACVTEGQAGYAVAGHFRTLDRAQEVARQRNVLNGLSEADVRVIVGSYIVAEHKMSQ